MFCRSSAGFRTAYFADFKVAAINKGMLYLYSAFLPSLKPKVLSSHIPIHTLMVFEFAQGHSETWAGKVGAKPVAYRSEVDLCTMAAEMSSSV